MSIAVATGLYDKLSATAAITSKLADADSIYHDLAPPDADYPFLILSKAGKSRRRHFGGVAFEDEIWLVKAVDRSESSKTAEEISEAVTATLTNGTIAVSGRVLSDLFPQADVDYLESDGDVQYRHHGATFRVVTTTP